jgi:hypothetical protein
MGSGLVALGVTWVAASAGWSVTLLVVVAHISG